MKKAEQQKVCQIEPAGENLRNVRQTDGVAQTPGKSLGGSKILLGTMSAQ